MSVAEVQGWAQVLIALGAFIVSIIALRKSRSNDKSIAEIVSNPIIRSILGGGGGGGGGGK